VTLVQLVALGKRSASGLNDPRVQDGARSSDHEHAAEDWLESGAISPGAADPRAYLIVLTGRFICTHCSYPAGATPPRGRSAQIVWVPGQGVSHLGLTQRARGTGEARPCSQDQSRPSGGVGTSSRTDAAGGLPPLPRRAPACPRHGERLAERYKPSRDPNLVLSRCCRGARR